MRLELTALAGSCWGPEPESVAAQQQFAGCIAIVGYRVKYSGVPVRPCAHEVGSCACAAFSSRRTRSPSVANGTVSALVDQLDRALHDHSSVDAFLELDEQLPPHQQLLRHLHDLSVSRIIVVRLAVKQAGVQPFRGGGCRAVGWGGGPSEASSSSSRTVRTSTVTPPPISSMPATEMPRRRSVCSKRASDRK